VKEYEGTAEHVCDPGDRALVKKAAFSEVLDELYKRPCGTCDCTGKSHFNKESTRTSFFISTQSEAIQGDNKMLYLQRQAVSRLNLLFLIIWTEILL